MNIKSLKKTLQENQVPSNLYSLSGGLPSESYCLNKVDNKWEVYYSERGVKSSIVNFDNESEACKYLLEQIGDFAENVMKKNYKGRK